MATKLFELGFLLRAIDAGLSRTLEKVNSQCAKLNQTTGKTAAMREFAGTLTKIGIAATGTGLALGLPLVGAVKGYQELEDHVDRVAAAMGGMNEAQRTNIENFAKQQSIVTGFDIGATTESLYAALSGFLNLNQAMAVTSVAGKLARGTQGDLAQTTNTLATAMLNFSDPAKTAAQNAAMLADKFAAIQTQGKWANLESLQYALSEGAPIAKAYGVSLDETLGSLSAFAASGKDGQKAGEAFLEVMTELGKGLPKLGLGFKENAKGGVALEATLRPLLQITQGLSAAQRGVMLDKVFGARAGGNIANLLDNLNRFHQASGISANSQGATNRAFDQFTNRGTLAFSQFQQAADALRDTIGGALAPAVEHLAKDFTALSVKIEAFAQKHPTIVKYAAEFTAISSAVLLTGGAISLASAALLGFASFIPA